MNNDFTCDYCSDPVPAERPIVDGNGGTYCGFDCLHSALLEAPDYEIDELPIGTRLTQQQVDSIPIGSLVLVVWPGGSIPSAYTVLERFRGVTIVNHGYCLGDVGSGPEYQNVTLARWGA